MRYDANELKDTIVKHLKDKLVEEEKIPELFEDDLRDKYSYPIDLCGFEISDPVDVFKKHFPIQYNHSLEKFKKEFVEVWSLAKFIKKEDVYKAQDIFDEESEKKKKAA
jgi:hypothetical protein